MPADRRQSRPGRQARPVEAACSGPRRLSHRNFTTVTSSRFFSRCNRWS